MIQAMYTGISGMKAFKASLDVIGNNVANINTVGYKAGRATFKEMLAQTMSGASAPVGNRGGVNASQVGLGVNIGSIDQDMSQGSMQSTGRQTDLAIEGNGYFALGDGSDVVYSRDGAFGLDASHNLVSASSGMRVLGWNADPLTGDIDTTSPVTGTSGIRVPIGALSSARATSLARIGGNLNPLTAGSKQSTAMNLTGNLNPAAALGTVYTAQPFPVYDSLGKAHNATATFTKTNTSADPTEWTYNITIPDMGAAPVATGIVTFSAGASTVGNVTRNLALTIPNGSTSPIPAAFNLAGLTSVAGTSNAVMSSQDGAAGAPYPIKFDVYDSLGLTHELNVYFTKTNTLVPSNPTEWTYSVVSGDVNANTPVSIGTITFDALGHSQLPNVNVSLNFATPNGSTQPLDFTIDTSEISQLNGSNTADMAFQDGLPLGTLESFGIDRNGIVTGTFSNGSTRSLGQVAIAIFNNPAGLNKKGNNLLSTSPNSGTPRIGLPGEGSRGLISAGFLEASNVDLAKEFANMIVAQRGFQANSRIITVSDEVLQELVSLKR